MQRIKEVIIIRAADPDGSMFRAIMDALRGRRAEVIELAAPSHDMLGRWFSRHRAIPVKYRW